MRSIVQVSLSIIYSLKCLFFSSAQFLNACGIFSAIWPGEFSLSLQFTRGQNAEKLSVYGNAGYTGQVLDGSRW